MTIFTIDTEEERVVLKKQIIKDRIPKLTSTQAFFTLLKGFVGTGILFLPNGFYNGGWAFATCSLLFSMCLTLTSMYLLLKVADKFEESYSQLGMRSLGPIGKYICDITLALSQTGFVTVHIVFISQNLNEILYSHFGYRLNIWTIGMV